MYGAILGDIIGSPYEFDRGEKTKFFPLFSENSEFTDDSVMSIAVAEALMDSMGKSEADHKAALTAFMQKWGREYPGAGYGGRFSHWLKEEKPQPYNSWGNGSAMRAASAGWLYDSLEETLEKAKWTAEVTHNHPEGIKGAECVAAAIFLARNGKGKEEIREYIIDTFGYNLSRTCDEIRPEYHHVESCQETVPEAVTAFLEGESFEDVIRLAVSLGGDCDTLTCIAGSIAEAFYSVPEALKAECRNRITPEMRKVLGRFDQMRHGKNHDMNYTYLLRCADGTLYCGWTNDPEKRLAAHNAGIASKYTASRRPVELVYLEVFQTKQEAMKREAAIKKMSRKEKQKLTANHTVY